MLICIVGPTCSGKSTLEKKLIKTGIFDKITSFTTRKPRTGEIDGVDYYFLAEPPRLDEVAELNYFNNNYYGVLLDEFLDKTNQVSKDVVIVVDPNGLNQFKRICKDYNVEISSVYLQQSIHTLMSRFFDRSRDDKNMGSKVFAARAVSMFSEWLTWGKLDVYDVVFEDFGPESEQDLIKYLTKGKTVYD